MKKYFFVMALLSLPVFAESLTDRIHSVVESNGNAIVRFEGGRVGFLSSYQKDFIASQTGALVQVELDRNNNLREYSVIEAPRTSEADLSLKNIFLEIPPVFEPTIITTQNLEKIFKSLDQNYQRLSECSDRAHVWAWDEFKRTGTKSEKAFIFFTPSYINRMRFKWWFHVAPMFSVQTNNGVEKMVTDFMYKDRPVTLKDWSNMMVFSGRDCKMTTKFSDYENGAQTEDCFMINESMYYRLPADIQNEEVNGIYRSTWNEVEVSMARARAFNVGRIQ